MNPVQITVNVDDKSRARTALDVAWNHFAWATGEKPVDAAIYEVNAAEIRLEEALARGGAQSIGREARPR